MKKTAKQFYLLAALIVAGASAAYADGPDILIADFEGTNYGAWVTTGTAFGSGPAQGTLPNQMTVDGFVGHGLVNSYTGGDDAKGTLTSPPFKIERKYLQFLIGGGGWEGKTCINLLMDGKVLRTETGPNRQSGGHEHLQSGQWDVSDLVGKRAVLQIVDDATGTWGHINVDQIVQSDNRISAPIVHTDVTRELEITRPYLNFPVKDGAPMRRVSVIVGGKTERSFDIELADGKPDWWALLDAMPFKHRTATIKVNKLPEASTGLSSIQQSREPMVTQALYQETMRPQFHFTSRVGWLNDPNGLVFYKGEYHLFYQHNPYGWNWGNMHWGHAVSRDLIHWKELPMALYPDEHGTMFSGSAVVDWNNTAGFQSGREPALVAMFTAAGKPFTQGLAYSQDRGRSWTKYDGNPVLGHIAAENRDPKVVWFAPEKKWVMALYLDGNIYALFDSKDLKHWSRLRDILLPGDSECPNFFEMNLDGDSSKKRWVFYGANGVYVVGSFDGQRFTAETQPRRLQHGNCWYASQVFSDLPDKDRCVLLPWGRLPNGEIFRGMPFNQMMGLPVDLTLRSTDAGPQLAVKPVKELEKLRKRTHTIKPQPLSPDTNPLAEIHGDLFELEAVIAPGDAKKISFDLRGVPVVYDAASHTVSCMNNHAQLAPENGKISLHIYVDRASVDIYGGNGSVYLPMAKTLAPENKNLKLSYEGGSASIVSMKVYELKSAW